MIVDKLCNADSAQWDSFLQSISSQPPAEQDALFRERHKTVVEVFKDMDVKVEEMRNALKKTFFNSIMTSRELIRTAGFVQLKIQNKATAKKTLIDKLMTTLVEDLKIFTVLREFKNTYYRAKNEIERRAKFDYLAIGLTRVMLRLVREENILRKRYIRDNGGLLPHTFCPFLVKPLSEQMIRQIEGYFSNDTSIDDLDEGQINRLRTVQTAVEKEDIAFSLRDLLEQYMSSAESLSSIHQTLALVLSGDQDVATANPVNQPILRPSMSGKSRIHLKIKESDLKNIEKSMFMRLAGDSAGQDLSPVMLSFVGDVQSSSEGVYGPTYVLESFREERRSEGGSSLGPFN